MFSSAVSIIRRPLLSALVPLAVAACLVVAAPAVADEAPGQTIFMAEKCNTCHAVSAADIEAKIKSAKMAGPDLSGYTTDDPAALAAYLRKEAELDGVMHKRETKVSDEDLQTLLDWLGSLEPAADAAR